LEKNINHTNGKQIIMATYKITKVIGNYKIELDEGLLIIRDLKDNLLKAEDFKQFEAEDKFNELCDRLQAKITR
tara:strand:+ start:1004 stop:1225 length:222 start_codon:yes stop_codon:yes gene_type:complete